MNGKGAVFLHPWHCGCAESSSVSSSLLVSCSLFTLGFVSCDQLAQSSKMHFNHDAAGRGRQGCHILLMTLPGKYEKPTG